MKRWMLALAVFAIAASAVNAHFIWIIPDPGDKTKVNAVFSDALAPDANVDIKKISKSKFMIWDASGRRKPATATLSENAYAISVLGEDTRVIGGICDYGVLQRGDSKPFRLYYCAKLILQPLSTKPLDEMPLEI